jgi:hypothetical protein
MRRTALDAMAALLAAAGCGTSAPSPQATVTVTAPPTASSSSQQASSLARANARLLMSALASGSPASIRSARDSVAGPVMTPYIRMQALLAEAAAASGQPQDVGSVTAISGGGYQICYPQGQGCQSFSAFRSDATGRITGMDVDGQPVAARLAVGPSDSQHGLVLTAVASYLGTSTGHVDVIFRVRNVSNHDISTGSPPFLPVFVTSPGGAQLNYDDFDSAIPGPLRPGESAAVVAAFHTRSVTGTISLRTNNGFEAILVSSRLRKPGT